MRHLGSVGLLAMLGALAATFGEGDAAPLDFLFGGPPLASRPAYRLRRRPAPPLTQDIPLPVPRPHFPDDPAPTAEAPAPPARPEPPKPESPKVAPEAPAPKPATSPEATPPAPATPKEPAPAPRAAEPAATPKPQNVPSAATSTPSENPFVAPGSDPAAESKTSAPPIPAQAPAPTPAKPTDVLPKQAAPALPAPTPTLAPSATPPPSAGPMAPPTPPPRPADLAAPPGPIKPEQPKPEPLKPEPAKPTVAPSGATLAFTPRSPEDDPQCPTRLLSQKVGIEQITLGPQPDARCTVIEPVHLADVTMPDGSKVAFPEHPTIACVTADSFSSYVRDMLSPLAKGTFGAPVAAVWTGPGLECRSRDHIFGAKLSAHGQGLAIDIAKLKLVDGRIIEVGTPSTPAEAAFETAARAGACGYFHTVLGPGSDSYHRTHWHFDLEVRGAHGDSKYCK